MKNATFSIALFAAAATIFFAGAWHPQGETVPAAALGPRTVLYYVDPMHPGYKSDKPGTAPDCGMALEPVYADATSARADAAAADAVDDISLTSDKQQLIGVRVSTVEEAAGADRLRLFGRVTPEEPRVYRVMVGTDGYMRNVAGVSTGSQVSKGQWLGTLSTPEARQPIQA